MIRARDSRNVVKPFLAMLAAILGRRRTYQTAQFLLRRALLEVPNDLSSNGENLAQRLVLEQFPRPVVFDVGANTGAWAEAMLRFGAAEIYAFEPCHETFLLLQQRLRNRAQLFELACSSANGTAPLHVRAAGAGTNTLAEPIDAGAYPSRQQITTITVADFCRHHGIDRIDLLKIDAEGHDFEVLLGAEPMLERISAIQFEYNVRWIGQRRFLRDAFQLLQARGFQVGRLTPQGVEFYSNWRTDLEGFREANYFAAREPLAGVVPRVEPAWLVPLS
jgi:FkbM family methyltransferase